VLNHQDPGGTTPKQITETSRTLCPTQGTDTTAGNRKGEPILADSQKGLKGRTAQQTRNKHKGLDGAGREGVYVEQLAEFEGSWHFVGSGSMRPALPTIKVSHAASKTSND
jgi:hypothetical protein